MGSGFNNFLDQDPYQDWSNMLDADPDRSHSGSTAFGTGGACKWDFVCQKPPERIY
jgi:hypothetical protein